MDVPDYRATLRGRRSFDHSLYFSVFLFAAKFTYDTLEEVTASFAASLRNSLTSGDGECLLTRQKELVLSVEVCQ
uniref:Uncharacterized protein n=1 Tax=Anguilla anguilla TaxID=7936 RepID=A0A0E9XF15_ANGAN